MGSRNGLSLRRYFPELVGRLREALPLRVVVDGEVVIAGAAGLDFDALTQRVHPAESRVRLLAETTPASFVAFDLLALGEHDLRGERFGDRRRLLEEVFAGANGARGVHLTPATADPAVAEDWFARFEGAGLDGVVAKANSLEYMSDKRAMVKVKHERTAEFVVGGFRWHRKDGQPTGQEVGSLMLGLYDDAGRLCHVGVIGALPTQQRRALVEVLTPHVTSGAHPWTSLSPQRAPGARSRWNAAKDLSFEPLVPLLVVEAAYEHLQGARLRHTAQFRRWRPERDPRSCTYAQLEAVVPIELAAALGA
jgi:ATP-dependent DNA ligase